MTLFSEQPSFDRHPDSPLENLPAEFEANLLRIDALISQQAVRDQSQGLPAGLNDRVFAASVTGLSLREVRRPAAKRSLVEVGVSRFTLWGMTWSRLAMAASIMLAIGAVAWTMHVNSTNPIHPSPLATNIKPGPGTLHNAARETAASSESTGDFQAVADASSDEVDARVSYLLEADRMSSLDDVQKEIAMLVSLDVH